MKFTKYGYNPILSANSSIDWENLCVLNPAVWYEEKDDTFYMLYRAAGNDYGHYIRIGLAVSKDGFNFTRVSNKPVLSPDIDGADGGCIEDPRIIKIRDTYYVTYASRTYAPGRYWSSDWKPLGDRDVDGLHFVKDNNSVTHLAISRDLRTFKKLGRITDSRYDDRDVIIFPEQIKGRYVKLSRPVEMTGEKYGCKIPSIFISYGTDLMEWGKPELLMTGKEWWEDKKIGGSCPPIKTEKGWFFIYHGVASSDSNYRVGAVLLDLKNPSRVIARTKDFLMEPEADFEVKGFYNGCVFPTGNAVKGDTLYVYYGAGDKYICAATCSFSGIIGYLYNECKI